MKASLLRRAALKIVETITANMSADKYLSEDIVINVSANNDFNTNFKCRKHYRIIFESKQIIRFVQKIISIEIIIKTLWLLHLILQKKDSEETAENEYRHFKRTLN